jgi:hypothetical protein
LHVVVPDEPVEVVCFPVVQLRASPALEIRAAAPVQLAPGAIYVVQLPRVYSHHGKVILLPSTPGGQQQCLLHRNALSMVS